MYENSSQKLILRCILSYIFSFIFTSKIIDIEHFRPILQAKLDHDRIKKNLQKSNFDVLNSAKNVLGQLTWLRTFARAKRTQIYSIRIIIPAASLVTNYMTQASGKRFCCKPLLTRDIHPCVSKLSRLGECQEPNTGVRYNVVRGVV